jgi:hypothetical protein
VPIFELKSTELKTPLVVVNSDCLGPLDAMPPKANIAPSKAPIKEAISLNLSIQVCKSYEI